VNPLELEALTIWQELSADIGLDTCADLDKMDRHRIIRSLIGWGVSDVVRTTVERLSAEGIDSVGRLRARGTPIIGFSDEAAARHRELKLFLFRQLYRHYRVVRMAAKAERVLRALFETYTEEPAQLPDAVQARIEGASAGLERIVCDYIAGMTDRFALQEYARLFDPSVRV
jgi:dGTPase